MFEVTIRAAVEGDLSALTDLYNHYVESSPVTFDIENRTLAERREWLSHYCAQGPHRLLVLDRAVDILGYASSSSFRPKEAYSTTVETSIYLRQDSTGHGLGRRLYETLFESLRGEDVHRALAGVTLPNAASDRLHLSLGFSEVGVFAEVGRKFDQFWSVRWYEKELF